MLHVIHDPKQGFLGLSEWVPSLNDAIKFLPQERERACELPGEWNKRAKFISLGEAELIEPAPKPVTDAWWFAGGRF